jgi:hypothetical protein
VAATGVFRKRQTAVKALRLPAVCRLYILESLISVIINVFTEEPENIHLSGIAQGNEATCVGDYQFIGITAGHF